MKVYQWVKEIDDPSWLYISILITASLAFFAGLLCALKTNWGTVVAPLATFVAAFVGPLLALSNSRKQSLKDEEAKEEQRNHKLAERRRQERDLQKQKLNYCSFVLSRYLEIINPIYRDIVKHTDFVELCIHLPPNSPAEHGELKVDYEGLSFLFHYDPNILSHLWLSVAKYEQALKAIQIRNRFMVSEFADKTAELKALDKKKPINDETDPEDMYGERIYHSCLQAGESLIQHIPDARASLCDSLKRLDDAANELFPEGGMLAPQFTVIPGKPPHAPNIYVAESTEG